MRFHSVLLATLFLSPLVLAAQGPVSPATSLTGNDFSWVDKDTGHRIMRLTAETNSVGLYFNQNAFTADGKKMIYTVNRRIYALDMASYTPRELVADPVSSLVVSSAIPTVYFMKRGNDALFAVDVASGQIRQLAVLPKHATISSLNASQTLIAGTYVAGEVPKFDVDPYLSRQKAKEALQEERLAAHIPMVLFTVNLQTAEVRTVLHTTDWLNHVQFSPTDPTLLLYCHEGHWKDVDRIWTIRTDGTQNQLIHKRTVDNEIAGHEYWDADGKTIWYDLQQGKDPDGKKLYEASYNTSTGERRRYRVERDAKSIHYNVASDDSLFCGDGQDSSEVQGRNVQWIELFTPSLDPPPAGADPAGRVETGAFRVEHLVNLAKQNYTLEPNVRFSPDNKLVIFTSNILGPSYVFAVEVAKTNVPPATAAVKAAATAKGGEPTVVTSTGWGKMPGEPPPDPGPTLFQPW